MHVPFKLTLGLATPFVMGNLRLTLDGLLSAAVFKETGLKGAETLPFIPLAQASGIFKGSSLFVPRQHTMEIVGRIMVLRGRDDQGVHLFHPNGTKGRYRPIDTKRAPYKANLSSMPGISAPEVYFWGVGDPERTVERIEQNILGIGRRSNAGAGQIVSVDWMDDADYSWMTPTGQPARPLPLDLWSEISGGRPAPQATIAVNLPYWESRPVSAVFSSDLVASW